MCEVLFLSTTAGSDFWSLQWFVICPWWLLVFDGWNCSQGRITVTVGNDIFLPERIQQKKREAIRYTTTSGKWTLFRDEDMNFLTTLILNSFSQADGNKRRRRNGNKSTTASFRCHSVFSLDKTLSHTNYLKCSAQCFTIISSFLLLFLL